MLLSTAQFVDRSRLKLLVDLLGTENFRIPSASLFKAAVVPD